MDPRLRGDDSNSSSRMSPAFARVMEVLVAKCARNAFLTSP